MTTATEGYAGGSPGLLDRERIIAKPGFNRWLVPPAALAIHLCIGMAYGFSVFWLPLTAAIPGEVTEACKAMGLGSALFSTECNWRMADLGWIYTLFFVLLGCSAAIWGGWLERVGPRKAGFVSACCWCGGIAIGAIGVYTHQLWIMWLGLGVIGGIGLGLGYISPVSTLIKWFPDRRGMATGMAIMGFGGGAMVGSPLAQQLMQHFATDTSPGVWQTFLVMAILYLCFMMGGAFGYRIPPAGWRPEGWTPPPPSKNTMITQHHVHLRDAHKTKQFWLIWIVLCMNVSAGIGILGAASPLLQEIFGGRLLGLPELSFSDLNADQKLAIAGIAAGFTSLLSLFNIIGRFFWASMSDKLGRKNTYFVFFILGIVLYASAPTFAQMGSQLLFVAAFCIILSMYGGGFATIPAYLADIFGTQFVGAIHGRLLTAWATAGILGPVVVNYIRQYQVDRGLSGADAYTVTIYVLCGMLVVGLIANALVRPLDQKWFMSAEEVAALQARTAATAATVQYGSYGIDKGRFDLPAALAWAVVAIPVLWGAWFTLVKTAAMF
ncbi:OFA family MFS transporter [Neotabrizicola sp. VNH66]|uniref:OFA family MFS transporter n=1 Tax=Neotabrizicola sp. VNH66 TaxID=3400918 RepID=UPI003BFFA806